MNATEIYELLGIIFCGLITFIKNVKIVVTRVVNG